MSRSLASSSPRLEGYFELLDPVVVRVRHEELAGLAHAQPRGIVELALPDACRAERCEEFTFLVEYLDPVVP